MYDDNDEVIALRYTNMMKVKGGYKIYPGRVFSTFNANIMTSTCYDVKLCYVKKCQVYHDNDDIMVDASDDVY